MLTAEAAFDVGPGVALIASTLIGSCFTFAALVLNRKWRKDDEQERRKTRQDHND